MKAYSDSNVYDNLVMLLPLCHLVISHMRSQSSVKIIVNLFFAYLWASVYWFHMLDDIIKFLINDLTSYHVIILAF